MLEKIQCPERDSNPRHPDPMKGALTTELPSSYKGISITRHLFPCLSDWELLLWIVETMLIGPDVVDSLHCGCFGSSVIRAPFMCVKGKLSGGNNPFHKWTTSSFLSVYCSWCSVNINSYYTSLSINDSALALLRRPQRHLSIKYQTNT